MDLQQTTAKRFKRLSAANRVTHATTGILGVVALALGVFGVSFGLPEFANADLFQNMFYVNAGAIGLLAIDFAYLQQVREMRAEVFKLLRASAGKVTDDNAPELHVLLTSLMHYVGYHSLVFMMLMIMIGAVAAALPSGADQVSGTWRLFTAGIGSMVAILHALHYLSSQASIRAFRAM